MAEKICKKDDLVYEKVIEILQGVISLVEILRDRGHKDLRTNIEKPEVSLESGLKPQGKRLIPVTKWNNYYDFPTVSALRQLIFNQHKNGFDKVVRRVGGRIVIKEDEFFRWAEENGSN